MEEDAAGALALLALVAGQDVEPAEGCDGRDGRCRIARKVAEDRIVSVPDPDARHTPASPARPAATGTGRTSRPTRTPGSSPMRS